MKKITLLIATTISLAALLVGAAVVFAADPPVGSGQALEIAPPVINLRADPGQTITTKINLRGVSSQTLLVTGEVNDFVAAGEDGTPKLLLDSEEEVSNPYSLKTWVKPLPELTLNPKQVKEMSVTITVPANAAPGGYYGVVRFTGTPPELKGTGVSLSASLGSLLFIRVSGQAQEGMQVEQFYAANDNTQSWLFESTPIKFVERLKNTGNTHLQPAGQVTVTDMFGQKVATLNVNLPPRNVLPASIRRFEQPMDSSVIGDKMLFGRYTADLRVAYGDNHQEVTASLTFWVIPYRLIGAIILLLIAAFFIGRTLIRRYNRRILRKSQGSFSIGSKRK